MKPASPARWRGDGLGNEIALGCFQIFSRVAPLCIGFQFSPSLARFIRGQDMAVPSEDYSRQPP